MRQVVGGHSSTAAETLGDVVAGQLNMQPTRPGAQRPVNLEESPHLVDDVVEFSGFIALGGLEGMAVHEVAAPSDLVSGTVNLVDQARQQIARLFGAEPGDERDLARLLIGVELLVEGDGVVGTGGGPELAADGVAYFT